MKKILGILTMTLSVTLFGSPVRSIVGGNHISQAVCGGGQTYDAEVAFLQSKGGACIDTGIPLNRIYGMYLEYNACGIASGIYKPIVGRGDGEFNFSTFSNRGFYMRYQGVHRFNVGEAYAETDNVAVIKDGTCDFGFTTGTVSGPFANSNKTLSMFGVKGWRTYEVRIYHLILYDANGDAMAEYIPVRKGTEGYMYEVLSGTMMANGNTGYFQMGEDT